MKHLCLEKAKTSWSFKVDLLTQSQILFFYRGGEIGFAAKVVL